MQDLQERIRDWENTEEKLVMKDNANDKQDEESFALAEIKQGT